MKRGMEVTLITLLTSGCMERAVKKDIKPHPVSEITAPGSSIFNGGLRTPEGFISAGEMLLQCDDAKAQGEPVPAFCSTKPVQDLVKKRKAWEGKSEPSPHEPTPRQISNCAIGVNTDVEGCLAAARKKNCETATGQKDLCR